MNCKYCGCYIPKYFSECPACASNSQKEIVAAIPAPMRVEIIEPQVVINFGDLFSHDKVYLHWGNLKEEKQKAKAMFKWWIKEHYKATDKFNSINFKLDAPYAIVGDLHECDVQTILMWLVGEKFLCYGYNFGNEFYFVRPQTKKEFKAIAKKLGISKNYIKKVLETY